MESVSENWIASRFEDCGFLFVKKPFRAARRLSPREDLLPGSIERVQIFLWRV